MTRFAITSTSPVIHRVLHDIATACGAELADDAPYRVEHQPGFLLLQHHDHIVQTLALPVRVQTIARWMTQPATSRPQLPHGWQFDPGARHLQHEGSTHALTEKESLLLNALLHAYPHACPREQLLQDVWGIATAVETHTLETHIYRLRSKLDALTPRPCDILTVEQGYQLQMDIA